MEALKKSKEIPWPPTVEDNDKMASEKLPEELNRFLNLVFSGNEPVRELSTQNASYFRSDKMCVGL